MSINQDKVGTMETEKPIENVNNKEDGEIMEVEPTTVENKNENETKVSEEKSQVEHKSKPDFDNDYNEPDTPAEKEKYQELFSKYFEIIDDHPIFGKDDLLKLTETKKEEAAVTKE